MTTKATAVLAFLLLVPAAVSGQTSPGLTFGVGFERQFIDSELPQWEDWESYSGWAQFRGQRGTVRAEVATQQRFGERDQSFTFDGYHTLGEGRYGHLRFRTTPDAQVLPSWDVRGEIFQVFGSWEGSASWWHMDFEQSVRVVGLGLARYEGDWYLRASGTRSTNSGESAWSGNLLARRSNDDGGALTLVGGRGSEVVLLGVGPVIDIRTTTVLRAELERWLTERVGITAVVGRHTFEGAPARFPVSIGVALRQR